MQLLKDRIRKDGKIKEGNVLKVDSFLNHQMDVKLFQEIGKEFKRRFADEEITKILTIEASGIGIACVAAEVFDVPVVFAKKNKTNTENKNIKNAATGLMEYILFFGIFFAAKMEYTDGSGSIKRVRALVKNYHTDPLVKKAFKKLVRDPRVKELSQLHWRVMLRLFSMAINWKLYGVLAVGIKVLVLLRIDERLSDTGLRE